MHRRRIVAASAGLSSGKNPEVALETLKSEEDQAWR